ncbi:MAG: zinc ribbon domain-containing protein [bacterium]
MRDNLLHLIELQSVDKELRALEALKGDLPQQVKNLETELNGFKDEHDKLRNEFQEVVKTKLHLEGELKVFQAHLKKYQEQLYSVTSNREYDAITVEIDSMQEKIDEAETQIIELLEQEEQLKKQVDKLASEIETYEGELQQKEAELSEKIKATENEYQVWENKRKNIASLLNKPILYQYERIRKVRGETSVVSVNKYACGGCFTTIPPQKVMEIKHMDQLIICESCGRILIFKKQDVALVH